MLFMAKPFSFRHKSTKKKEQNKFLRVLVTNISWFRVG